MAEAFLDTNVWLRHLLQDHAEQSRLATDIFRRIESGDLDVRGTPTVVFEVVFGLERWHDQPRAAIRDVLLPLLDLTGIELPGKRRYRRVFDLYVDLNVSFADAYHAVLMDQLKIDKVISFDRDFDRVRGLTRIEP